MMTIISILLLKKMFMSLFCPQKFTNSVGLLMQCKFIDSKRDAIAIFYSGENVPHTKCSSVESVKSNFDKLYWYQMF